MGLVDYISRNPYQPAKSISKYDEEFLVATLTRIHFDAKLLQQKHNISANKLYLKLYHFLNYITKMNVKHKTPAIIINKYWV